MTLQEVKKACNDLLAAEFPEIEVYNGDTLDGYQRPSFFTEILTRGAKARASPYITEVGYTFKITYFEWIHREADCLELYESLESRWQSETGSWWWKMWITSGLMSIRTRCRSPYDSRE